MDAADLNDFTQRLLPLTVLRRRAGKILSQLPKVRVYIVTKDGKPVAKLSVLDEPVYEETTRERLARLKPLIGGFRLGRGLSPKRIGKLLDKRYEEVLPR